MTKQIDVLENPNYRAVLDHGFVGLIDTMGSDAAIVQAARVSYGAGTKTVNEDRGLIRYLLRHKHTTPFEMCETKWHFRAPILVLRQAFRHRTMSVNEESARYSEMSDEFYLPGAHTIQPQSSDNKQGRAGTLSTMDQRGVLWMMDAAYSHAHDAYKVLLGDRVGRDPEHPGIDVLYDVYDEQDPILSPAFGGVAREIARAVMPVGSYSECYLKMNLHNLFHFLKLRADPHAQYEIRVFAEAMIELARPHFAEAFAAFEDYVRGALTLSRMEAALLIEVLHPEAGDTPTDTLRDLIEHAGGTKAFGAARSMSVREVREFAERFRLAGALPVKAA